VNEVDETKKKNGVLGSLAEITKHKDVDILEISLAKTIFELFDAAGVSFFRMQKGEDKIYSVISVSETGVSLVHEKEEIEKAAAPFKAFFDELRLKGAAAKRISSEGRELSVRPILFGEIVVGFLVIAFSSGKKLNEKVIDGFLCVYANYHDLLVDNQHDTLTGLLNRKTFEERLYHFMEVQSKSPTTREPDGSKRSMPEPSWGFWLGIFDIDNFKRINDSFGHIYGDDVLISLAGIVRRSFRPMDIKLRFGGEEFVVVIRARCYADAKKVFERFRQNVEKHDFGLAGTVTVSIGLKTIEPHEVVSQLVGRADQALYHAKRTGKNRLCVYEELVEQGIIATDIHYGDVVLFD